MSDLTKSIATLAEVIKQGVNNRLKNLHTSMTGIIVSFDSVTQFASVQPAIKRVFKSDEADGTTILTPTDLPILINVPVQFPRGGGFSMTFPVAAGDECLLMFAERSIDKWHTDGRVSEPGARRFHDLSDATCIVGLSSRPNAIPNFDSANVEIKKDDASVSVKLLADGTIEIDANTKILFGAPDSEFSDDVKILGNLEVVGNTDITANLTVVGSSLLSANVTSNSVNISDTHKHNPTTGLPE